MIVAHMDIFAYVNIRIKKRVLGSFFVVGKSKPQAMLVVPKSFSFAHQKPPMLKLIEVSPL